MNVANIQRNQNSSFHQVYAFEDDVNQRSQEAEEESNNFLTFGFEPKAQVAIERYIVDFDFALKTNTYSIIPVSREERISNIFKEMSYLSSLKNRLFRLSGSVEGSVKAALAAIACLVTAIWDKHLSDLLWQVSKVHAYSAKLCLKCVSNPEEVMQELYADEFESLYSDEEDFSWGTTYNLQEGVSTNSFFEKMGIVGSYTIN